MPRNYETGPIGDGSQRTGNSFSGGEVRPTLPERGIVSPHKEVADRPTVARPAVRSHHESQLGTPFAQHRVSAMSTGNEGNEVHKRIPDEKIPEGQDQSKAISEERQGTSETRDPKEVPVIVDLLSHGESDEDHASIKVWADRGRSILRSIDTGKVAFVLEDEYGTKEYSNAVRDRVRGGMRPSDAKIAAVLDLDHDDLTDADREALFARGRENQSQGFEGAILRELDDVFDEFGPEHMDVVVEYHPPEYEVDAVDVSTVINGIVASDEPKAMKALKYSIVANQYAPKQHSRDENYTQVIGDAAAPDDVVAVVPFIGAGHLGVVENLQSDGHTDVQYNFGESHEGKHYYTPLMGLFVAQVRNPNAVPSQKDIEDALELEETIRFLDADLRESGEAIPRQQLLAEAYEAFTVEKEMTTGASWQLTEFDPSGTSGEVKAVLPPTTSDVDERMAPQGKPSKASSEAALLFLLEQLVGEDPQTDDASDTREHPDQE